MNEVLKDRPKGAEVNIRGNIINMKEIVNNPEYLDNKFYYCLNCKGYIMGLPMREGVSHWCIRCGDCLGFERIMP